MGIANITPDSFSDGGDLSDSQKIAQYLQQLVKDNATIIDIGAESTKPDANAIEAETEIMRLKNIGLPLQKIKNILFSIDTYKAKTAHFALENGFDIVNDVTGLKHHQDIAKIVTDYHAGIILMYNHRLNQSPSSCIVSDVLDGLKQSIDIALSNNVAYDNICLDLGIGFGLKPEQNLILLKNMSKFKELGFPVMVGASRKSLIPHYIGPLEPKERVYATLALHHYSARMGADILRIHDVKAHSDFFKMLQFCHAVC